MVARVEFSMVGRVIRYQSSGIRKRANSEQRSATRRQEKTLRRGHREHRVRREDKPNREEKRSCGFGA